MSKDDELIAVAEIGEKAREFLESELGRCLVGIAEQDLREAQEQLELVDPMDTDKIMSLQNDARFARSYKQRLEELLYDGENALSVFQQRKNEQ